MLLFTKDVILTDKCRSWRCENYETREFWSGNIRSFHKHASTPCLVNHLNFLLLGERIFNRGVCKAVINLQDWWRLCGKRDILIPHMEMSLSVVFYEHLYCCRIEKWIIPCGIHFCIFYQLKMVMITKDEVYGSITCEGTIHFSYCDPFCHDRFSVSISPKWNTFIFSYLLE